MRHAASYLGAKALLRARTRGFRRAAWRIDSRYIHSPALLHHHRSMSQCGSMRPVVLAGAASRSTDRRGRAGKRHRPVRGRDCAQSRVPRPGQVSAQIGRPVRAHLPAMVNACDLYDSAASPKGELWASTRSSAREFVRRLGGWRPVRQTTRDRTSRAEESWNPGNSWNPGIPESV